MCGVSPGGTQMKRMLWVCVLAACLWPAFGAEYGDIKFERKVAGMEDVPPAIFPHWIHRMQYKCGACHDSLFKMKAGSSAITMDDMQAGQNCGTCHNSKVAFESNFDTCPRCHLK
jgi:c(7)-type cytochrome triheme protein